MAKKHKYYGNWVQKNELKCTVCRKDISELNEEIKNMAIEDRIDRKLPGEKSHFKHIHVKYLFCSKECRELFDNEEVKSVRDSLRALER